MEYGESTGLHCSVLPYRSNLSEISAQKFRPKKLGNSPAWSAVCEEEWHDLLAYARGGRAQQRGLIRHILKGDAGPTQ